MKRRPIITRLRQHFLGESPRWNALISMIKKKKISIYVEVGVWEGFNLKAVAKNCKTLKKIYAVDPYDSKIEYSLGGIYSKGDQKKVNSAKKRMLTNTKKFDNIEHMFMTSKEASKHFKKNSLDMVFIDAVHTYGAVKEDINVWLPKIKKGGIIAGHDYNNRWKEHVVKAVDEKFSKSEIMLFDGAVWAVNIK